MFFQSKNVPFPFGPAQTVAIELAIELANTSAIPLTVESEQSSKKLALVDYKDALVIIDEFNSKKKYLGYTLLYYMKDNFQNWTQTAIAAGSSQDKARSDIERWINCD